MASIHFYPKTKKTNHFDLLIRGIVFLALCSSALLISGCSHVPLERSSLQNTKSIHLVQVISPVLETPTFMQQAEKSGALTGLLPALIVESQKKTTISSQSIPDIGNLITTKLKSKLGEQVPWWPAMSIHDSPVPTNYVYQDGIWLRIEVKSFIITSLTDSLVTVLSATLLNPQSEGPALWHRDLNYVSTRDGGEKIVRDKIADDPTQLIQQINLAAENIANRLVKDIVASETTK